MHFKIAFSITKEIFRERGLKGFTNTASVTLPKRLLRESCRMMIIKNSNDVLIKRYPKIFKRDGINIKLTSASVATAFNALCIVPLEQLISFKIKEKESYSEFFRKRFARDGISSLYKGWRVDLANQLAVWTLMMGVDHHFKLFFDKYDPQKNYPYLRQGTTSVLVASTLVTCTLPINFVKTRIQMVEELQNMNTVTVVRTLFKQFGVRGFYSGAAPVFVHVLLHATCYGKIFDCLYTEKKQ